MAPSKRDTAIFTTSLLPPPGPNTTLTLPTRTIPSPLSNPQLFNDALAVRLEVFVDEQKCAAEFEIDDDDTRSWQWVIYDTNATYPGAPSPIKLPVAVIRLVPPPHAPHDSLHGDDANGEGHASANGDGSGSVEKYDLRHEPHIKFGRVAVLAGYRGCGLARRLMETAMAWAGEHAEEINQALMDVVEKEGDLGTEPAPAWKGLVLVHAQVDVEKMYQRLGFVTDEGLGRWIEEGIEHVGMWRRLEVIKG
ncbi:GNAT family N-acetyltransferase [Aspergillus lucknowensis]|uniref:Acyl-CoA N-acyltransferase n=1 Tax=Aspergillus lucknowensis TaxID=176173 RepID=A0ABR4LXL8_9EURO